VALDVQLDRFTHLAFDLFGVSPGAPQPGRSGTYAEQLRPAFAIAIAYRQLKRITKELLDNFLVCKGGTYPAQLMYQELADMACNSSTAAITRKFIGERPIKRCSRRGVRELEITGCDLKLGGLRRALP
jgi:hypothetical protein